MEQNPSDWTVTPTEGGETFPFVEDENANITGLGHQDHGAFAAAVNRYDAECGMDVTPEDAWTEDFVTHHWVTLDADGERLHVVPEGTPEAFAVTGLWGQR